MQCIVQTRTTYDDANKKKSTTSALLTSYYYRILYDCPFPFNSCVNTNHKSPKKQISFGKIILVLVCVLLEKIQL